MSSDLEKEIEKLKKECYILRTSLHPKPADVVIIQYDESSGTAIPLRAFIRESGTLYHYCPRDRLEEETKTAPHQVTVHLNEFERGGVIKTNSLRDLTIDPKVWTKVPYPKIDLDYIKPSETPLLSRDDWKKLGVDLC